MYFKLQKDHERFTDQPEPVHGLRVRQVGTNVVEAEISLCFQYDEAEKMFNLFSKRLNKNEQPRYDLLTTAKLNSVWCIEFQADKQRRFISATLSNAKGEEYVFAMPYQHYTPVLLQSILPGPPEEQHSGESTEMAPAAIGPFKTMVQMWHEFRARKKKVDKVRRGQ